MDGLEVLFEEVRNRADVQLGLRFGQHLGVHDLQFLFAIK